ncbi:ketoacyl-ACP synthase III [Marinicrinis lubricantis]|uniref:Beta-ketoacyl-[acyl-carrier-protein] synthase III n=1 Tax=Marinicrinis lubricantis TaxID=2086470 RepID=A0ABW1IL82_9BACL
MHNHITAKLTASITAIGGYVPEKILTNDDLERLVDTNDEWITTRTGMKERRITSEQEFTSDMCVRAAEDMIARYHCDLSDVDMILVSTSTPDYAFPSTAALLQDRLNLPQVGAIDLNATCAGFTYAIHMAAGLITSGLHHKIIVFAAETLSKVTNYEDRSTCILFGDGAGAALVEYTDEPGIFGSYLYSNGGGAKHVYRSGLSNTLAGEKMEFDGLIYQNGREVYKWAVTTVPEGMSKLLDQTGFKMDDVSWFVPHSANLRMIESICEKSGMPFDKTLYSLEYYGNTSAATIPLSILKGLDDGKVKDGDLMMLYGFGGGLVQAALMIRWKG